MDNPVSQSENSKQNLEMREISKAIHEIVYIIRDRCSSKYLSINIITGYRFNSINFGYNNILLWSTKLSYQSQHISRLDGDLYLEIDI